MIIILIIILNLFLINIKRELNTQRVLSDYFNRSQLQLYIEAKSAIITEVREITNLITEYEGNSKFFTLWEPSVRYILIGCIGLEFVVNVYTSTSDICFVNIDKLASNGKSKIMKHSVICVTVKLEVLMETNQYQ